MHLLTLFLAALQIKDMEAVVDAYKSGAPEPSLEWSKTKPWEIAANMRNVSCR